MRSVARTHFIKSEILYNYSLPFCAVNDIIVSSNSRGGYSVKYTVLVVDDEQEQRLALTERVDWDSAGFEVVGEAENGVEALDVLET